VENSTVTIVKESDDKVPILLDGNVIYSCTLKSEPLQKTRS